MSLVLITLSIPLVLVAIGYMLSTDHKRYRSLIILFGLYVMCWAFMMASWQHSAMSHGSTYTPSFGHLEKYRY
jgi:hypothetical protein